MDILAEKVTFDADTKLPLTKEEMKQIDWTGWENIIPFIIISSAITQMSVSVSSIKAMMEEKWFIPMFLLCL